MQKGKFSCDNILPGTTSNIVLPSLPGADTISSEICLNIYVRLKSATIWAEEGFCIAREQFVIKPYLWTKVSSDEKQVTVTESPLQIELKTEKMTFTLDKKTGS